MVPDFEGEVLDLAEDLGLCLDLATQDLHLKEVVLDSEVEDFEFDSVEREGLALDDLDLLDLLRDFDEKRINSSPEDTSYSEESSGRETSAQGSSV